MEIRVIQDKDLILSFLKKKAEIQIYCIGDLDDFFWPDTKWFGLNENKDLKAIALLYSGMETPTLLMFHNYESHYSLKLLESIKPFLPKKFYAHLGQGLMDLFEKKDVDYFGLHYKMALKEEPHEVDDKEIKRLSVADLASIDEFYSLAYPQNWFDKRMLETGKYFGYFLDDRLTGISGIHVYSGKYRVAALGNIATHPDYRGQNIGYKLTMKLCFDLRRNVDLIGLNVRSDNDHAIKCYRKAGFEIVGEYDECLIHHGS